MNKPCKVDIEEALKDNHHGRPEGLSRGSELVVETHPKLTKTHRLTALCSETQTEGKK